MIMHWTRRQRGLSLILNTNTRREDYFLPEGRPLKISKNQYYPDYTQVPGEILLEILQDRGMSQTQLAEWTGIKRKAINQIIKGIAPITPETALQLERAFGVPAKFWDNMDRNYREDLARLKKKYKNKFKNIL